MTTPTTIPCQKKETLTRRGAINDSSISKRNSLWRIITAVKFVIIAISNSNSGNSNISRSKQFVEEFNSRSLLVSPPPFTSRLPSLSLPLALTAMTTTATATMTAARRAQTLRLTMAPPRQHHICSRSAHQARRVPLRRALATTRRRRRTSISTTCL